MASVLFDDGLFHQVSDLNGDGWSMNFTGERVTIRSTWRIASSLPNSEITGAVNDEEEGYWYINLKAPLPKALLPGRSVGLSLPATTPVHRCGG